jgi:hypothetical protein
MSEKVTMSLPAPPAYPTGESPVPEPLSAAQLGDQYRSERMSLILCIMLL